MVQVTFSDLHGQLKAEKTFTEQTTIRDAVTAGLEALNCPRSYDSGEEIRWRARELSTGALLGPEQEISDLQGPDPVVQLIAEVPAA